MSNEILTIQLADVTPWPKLNPRTHFPTEALEELAESIRTEGLMQPVGVKPLPDGGYWLIWGERRYRASLLAEGVETIDVVVRNIDEASAHRLAGLENLDRNDLTPIEEARWLARELELNDGLTQEKLAEDLGRSQAWVANRIRLLAFPSYIVELIDEGIVAPAMARDELLRYLKVAAKPRAKILRRIAKRAKAAGAGVPRLELRKITAEALGKAGERISTGHQYVRKNTYRDSVNLTAEDVKRFKAGLGAGMVVQGPWHVNNPNTEATWCFDEPAWRAFLKETFKEQEAAREERAKEERKAKRIPKARLESPGLGPDKRARSSEKMDERFGGKNWAYLRNLKELDDVDPSHVVPVTSQEYRQNPETGTWRYQTTRELAYVGPDVAERRYDHRAEVDRRVRRGRRAEFRKALEAGGKLSAADALRALLGLVAKMGDRHGGALCDLLETEGHEVPKSWRSHYENDSDLDSLELDDAALRRLAGAVIVLGSADTREHHDAIRARKERAEKAVDKARGKAAAKWIAEHAPQHAEEE